MPETKRRPLEEMNELFATTSWFVPSKKNSMIMKEMANRDGLDVIEKDAIVQVEDMGGPVSETSAKQV